MFNVGDIVEATTKGHAGKPSFVLEICGVSQDGLYKYYGYKHIGSPDPHIYSISHEWLWKNARKRALKRSVKHYFEGT